MACLTCPCGISHPRPSANLSNDKQVLQGWLSRQAVFTSCVNLRWRSWSCSSRRRGPVQACASAAARAPRCPAARPVPTAGSVDNKSQVTCGQGMEMPAQVKVQNKVRFYLLTAVFFLVLHILAVPIVFVVLTHCLEAFPALPSSQPPAGNTHQGWGLDPLSLLLVGWWYQTF